MLDLVESTAVFDLVPDDDDDDDDGGGGGGGDDGGGGGGGGGGKSTAQPGKFRHIQHTRLLDAGRVAYGCVSRQSVMRASKM